jgi:hypothetical protein
MKSYLRRPITDHRRATTDDGLLVASRQATIQHLQWRWTDGI